MAEKREYTPVPRHPNVYSYETKKGTRYRVREGFRNMYGKADEFSKQGLRSVRDAEAVLKTFERDLAVDNYANIRTGQITLDQAWRQQLEQKTSSGSWRPGTAAIATQLYNNYWKKTIGNMKLIDIRRPLVQRLLNKYRDDGFAPSTLKSMYDRLKGIMNDAVKNEMLDRNHILGLSIPRITPVKVEVDADKIADWLVTAQEVLTQYEFDMIAVMANTGMRRGEVLGLMVDDIEFRKDEVNNAEIALVNIRHQRLIDEKGPQPLKTLGSNRTIALDGKMVDILHHAVLMSNNVRCRNGRAGEKYDWLWLDQLGAPVSTSRPRYLCSKVNIVNGTYMHPHAFRHYFATVALNNGASQSAVMHYLGHTTERMTIDYTRPTDNAALSVFRTFSEPDGTKTMVPSNTPPTRKKRSN